MRCAPLRRSRSMNRRRLVGLWVDVLGNGSVSLVGSAGRGLAILQQLKTSLDMYIGRIQVGGTLVGVQSVCSLVVA